MPHAVTLPLDAAAAERIRCLWRALAGQAGSDDALRLGYPPHLTLAVLPDEAPVAAIEAAVSRAVEGWTALSTVLAGFGVFPGTPAVVWAAPVVTEALLARHAALCAAVAPLGLHPHYRPGQWVPHVTLSQAAAAPARAIEVVAARWEGPIPVRLGRVELVRFPPVTILRGHALGPAA